MNTSKISLNIHFTNCNRNIILRIMTDSMNIFIVGGAGTGKTCMFSRLIDNRFIYDYKMTDSLDKRTKNFIIDENPVRVTLWDVAGRDDLNDFDFNKWNKVSCGAMVLYDSTSKASFNKAHDILKLLSNFQNIKLILIGSKIDQSEKRSVMIDDGAKLAGEWNALFSEISSLENKQVFDTFATFIKKVQSD
ncbi:Ras-related protein RABA4d [Tritrichomonas foetus]|uniref:Ras-related protein RABA4d n=1 Tax=Tritrichomonas foetus TaxID=1144522 RepID=A0A1J4JZ83_9EUKA|nr:Ras-related protein RABA4d [Tritrichomonas foetus]|eukprot:OHT02565.1 Ras-related protein RABA4d [Tritrichomonas foetus]